MILLADSGSTKTDWWLTENGKVVREIKTVGFNPYYVTSEKMAEVLKKDFFGKLDPQKTEKVYFYGAGCSSPSKKAVIEKGLRMIFGEAHIEADHDMLAAARALFGNNKGIACILGTGSNSCLYDGKDIAESLFSLGYMFGDEGSGAHLGKTYIAKHLKNRIPEEIKEAFDEHYGLSHEEILTTLYQQPNPNRFLASFTRFLKKQLDHTFVFQLVENCFDEFFEEQVSKFTGYQSLPFGCIGSIGFHFKKVLLLSAKKYGVKPETFQISPMQGLLEFHCMK